MTQTYQPDISKWHHFVPRGDGVSNCKICHQSMGSDIHDIYVRAQYLEAEAYKSNHLIREVWAERDALRETLATLRQILDDCDYMPLEAVELIDSALALKEQAK